MEAATSVRPIAKSAQARIRSVVYEPTATLAEARDLYFSANGFPEDGGYDAAWVDFELGPIPLPFPNTEPRRRAVRIHDLHHVLTGYTTDIYGEGEISAWELGGGCGRMWAAWALNLGGMALGMLIAPRRTWRAWVRGRSSKTLYDRSYDAALLAHRVGEMRVELGLDQKPRPARVGDALAFLTYWQIGAWSTLALLPLTVATGAVAAVVGLLRKSAGGAA